MNKQIESLFQKPSVDRAGAVLLFREIWADTERGACFPFPRWGRKTWRESEHPSLTGSSLFTLLCVYLTDSCEGPGFDSESIDEIWREANLACAEVHIERSERAWKNFIGALGCINDRIDAVNDLLHEGG